MEELLKLTAPQLPLYKYSNVRTSKPLATRTRRQLIIEALYVKTLILRTNILLNALKEYIFYLFINLKQRTTYLSSLKLLNLPKTTLRSLISIYNSKLKMPLKDYASLSSKKNRYVFLFLLTCRLLITRTSLYRSGTFLY
jgi:hypothetical protein